MGKQFLHIVCLDVPYPPDYGGVFDLYYKIKYLHEAGIQIHLHCFEYGRGRPKELESLCLSIRYYNRLSATGSLSFRLPYIVKSRANPELLQQLSKDDHPVLLEGIHCTQFLFDGSLKGRNVWVRLHNVEYEYYHRLAVTSRNPIRKLYFIRESRRLRSYENALASRARFIAVSLKDAQTYREKLGAKQVEYLPVFLPYRQVRSQEGTGNFCLYHGNLSVPENESVALWLIEEVFRYSDTPLIIAGKNPSAKLRKAVAQKEHTCLVANPTEQDMEDLIRKAHLHLLPSLNATGIKIKLIHALFNGRFVIANQAAVAHTGLQPLCVMAEEAESFATAIANLIEKPFTEKEIARRKTILEPIFDQEKNVQQLIRWIC